MAPSLITRYEKRQHMLKSDFEIFYYQDKSPAPVERHSHDFYELYYFLEGNVTYRAGDKSYSMEDNDFLLLPPGVLHGPLFSPSSSRFLPYRRIVFWFSESFLKELSGLEEDILWIFSRTESCGEYHFRPSPSASSQLYARLVSLIEETKAGRCCSLLEGRLLAASLLVYLNRLEYQKARPEPTKKELYLAVCDAVARNLDRNLTLDMLAEMLFVSKYHLAHDFKEHMGISIHKYIQKKKLSAAQSGILAGESFESLSCRLGFKDYSTFYRAFKNEFGMSPGVYKKRHPLKP